MRWQVTKAGVPTGDMVDDGLPHEPGEEGFTTAIAITMAKEMGGDGVSYMGRSETEGVS